MCVRACVDNMAAADGFVGKQAGRQAGRQAAAAFLAFSPLRDCISIQSQKCGISQPASHSVGRSDVSTDGHGLGHGMVIDDVVFSLAFIPPSTSPAAACYFDPSILRLPGSSESEDERCFRLLSLFLSQ
jgi:hypothetical protein